MTTATTTATLSGQVLSPEGAPITGLCIMAVNAHDIRQQRQCLSDATGSFSLELPTGLYDLLYVDTTHEPLVQAGVGIEQDLALTITRPPVAAASSTRLHGSVKLSDGTPAAGITLELHDGTASTRLAAIVADDSGHFEFDGCEYGYHLLVVRDASGAEHWVPTPKPESSIQLDIVLSTARPLAPLLDSHAPVATAADGSTFTVCQNTNAQWFMKGGFLSLTSGPLGTNVFPVVVNVYMWQIFSLVFLYVDRRAPVSVFAPARPPGGVYTFTDEMGNSCFLTAILPYLHSVLYDGTTNIITAVQFTQGIPYSGAWPGAPICGPR